MAAILLVEPDQTLGETYQAYLKHQGHEVRWSKTAAHAVELLDVQPADLIITEIQIAGHNGLELIYEIRSYQDWQNLPIIINTVVSAEYFAPDFQQQFGVNYILDKYQATLKQLSETVNLVLA